MGRMCHHTIVVTGFDDVALQQAHSIATMSGLLTTNVVHGTNGYRSFCVVPDGSKEGWPKSDEMNEQRALLVRWLRHESSHWDGHLDWVELQFGDETHNACRILNDSGMNG